MITANPHLRRPQLFYRITALWVICEAFAGGLLHAAKIPFTGMVVSGLAICCIALLAWFVPGKGNILKATIIVAIFKLILSPHSPPTAYVAVFFQGLLGQLLLSNKNSFRPAIILVAVLGLAESAMQRLLVLWIVYGESFWTALNKFIQKLTGDKSLTNYSLLMGTGYIIIHVIGGVFIGIFIYRLIKNLHSWQNAHPQYIFANVIPSSPEPESTKKKKSKWKKMLTILSVCLLIFYILSFIKPAWAPLPANKIATIFLRSIVILLSWYFIFAPLVMSYLRKKILEQQHRNQEDVNKVMQVLPEMRSIFQHAWIASKEKQGLRRISLFVNIILVNAIQSS